MYSLVSTVDAYGAPLSPGLPHGSPEKLKSLCSPSLSSLYTSIRSSISGNVVHTKEKKQKESRTNKQQLAQEVSEPGF